MHKEARISKATLVALVGALVVATIIGGAAISSALHRTTPVFVQVTDHTGDVGIISAFSPQFWAFEALGDVVGNCSTGWNIFRFDLTLRSLGGAPGLTQVSFGAFNARDPSISKRGDIIAFEADGGLCSNLANRCENPNPVSGRQIFVWYGATGRIKQVTRGPGDMRHPDLTGRGRNVVFDTTTDLLGTGAIGTTPELYIGDLTRLITPTCPQLPCPGSPPDRGLRKLTTGGGQNGAVNFNGKVVAFESRGDNANGGANPGVQHIYVVNNGLLQQVTEGTPLDSRHPNINKNGRIVSFEQDHQNLDSSIVPQIVVASFKKKGTIIINVTRHPAGSSQPSLDANGRRVAFRSAGDLLLKSTPPNQIYIYDIRRNLLTQITGGPTGGDSPEATTGVIMGLDSQDDLTGNGNTTRQFFVSNFFRKAPFTFPSPFPGTPTPLPSATPTPLAGAPHEIGLALLTDESAPNGNNTLTTVIAATVLDFYGNPVPDGTFVDFNIVQPTNGAIISDGATNHDPACDVSTFETETGVQVVNQPGVAHACVTYPGAQVGTTRTIEAIAVGGNKVCIGGSNAGALCIDPSQCPGGSCVVVKGSGVFTLPPPVNHCEFNGTTCSDHNPCTVNDVCGGGTTQRACVGGPNAGAPCTVASQCPGGQCVLTNPPSCISGPLVTCSNDGDPCTNDFCNEFNGLCHQPIVCDDDGNPCTTDVCDPASNGACGINKPPAQCAGGANTDAACTVASECPGGVCVLNACEDGDPCTENDSCGGGSTTRTCVGGANSAIACTNASECPGGACLLSMPATCQPGTTVICPDDFNPCTNDICDPEDGLCGVPIVPCVCGP